MLYQTTCMRMCCGICMSFVIHLGVRECDFRYLNSICVTEHMFDYTYTHIMSNACLCVATFTFSPILSTCSRCLSRVSYASVYMCSIVDCLVFF